MMPVIAWPLGAWKLNPPSQPFTQLLLPLHRHPPLHPLFTFMPRIFPQRIQNTRSSCLLWWMLYSPVMAFPAGHSHVPRPSQPQQLFVHFSSYFAALCDMPFPEYLQTLAVNLRS